MDDIHEDDELSELEGEELKQSVKLVMGNQMERIKQRMEANKRPTLYENSVQNAAPINWKKAESRNRGLGYNGHAPRTLREHAQKKEKPHKETKR